MRPARRPREPPVGSLAVTDALLCGAAFWVASRPGLPLLLRASAMAFAAAAFFGVLRFTGLHTHPFPHQWLTLIVGTAAFPALAFAVARPGSRVTREPLPMLALLCTLGAVGVLVVRGLGIRPYMDACAVLSVVAVFLAARQRSDRIAGAGALAMLVGLMCFAAEFPGSGPLAPGDLLHLGLATGWVLIARSRR
jgi:hypothetical protein